MHIPSVIYADRKILIFLTPFSFQVSSVLEIKMTDDLLTRGEKDLLDFLQVRRCFLPQTFASGTETINYDWTGNKRGILKR